MNGKQMIDANDVHWFEDAFRAWENGDMEGVLDGLSVAVSHFARQPSKTGAELMAAFDDAGWTAKREALEAAVLAASEALLAHTEAAGVTLPGDGIEVEIRLAASSRRKS